MALSDYFYTDGTISVTNGSTAIVGVGTAWQLRHAVGAILFVGTNIGFIASVTDEGHAVLTQPWAGATAVGAAYTMWLVPGEASQNLANNQRLSQIIQSLTAAQPESDILSAIGSLVFEVDDIIVATGANTFRAAKKLEFTNGAAYDKLVNTLADRATYDLQAAGFTVLVANLGDGRSALYSKNSATAGDWSNPAYLTGPNGTFQSKGVYSAATAYVVGDVVVQNGSSWIARVNTAGNPPPALPTTSNTQWFLLSAAGNGFVFRGAYSGATAYVEDDVVLYNNSTWIALVSTTGNAPPALPTTSNTQWSLLAAKGVGDVSGPATNADGNLALWNGANTKTLKDGGPITAAGIALANITGAPVADRMPYLTAANAGALTILTTLARSLLDDTTGAAMAATMGYVQGSTGSSWWVKLPGGLIIQWGSTIATVSGGGGGVGIALAQAYTTSASWSFSAMNGEQASGAVLLGGYPAGKSASGMLIVLKNSTNGLPVADGVAYRVDWVAAGV